MNEEHKNCKYRFKGKSCEDCPLNCKFKRLQEENEELKARLQTLDDEVLTVEITLEEFERCKKYKQALEEIRELAEVNSLNTCWTMLNNCNDCHNNNECGEQSPIAKLKFIKDKVNEVLNDRN